ncbi:MAG: nucleotidyl transferase AbiEii/AbiGii toxin family protein [Candidatus Pacebacteria bacterium]|nr:nucleotidyl transferase AbiEii/AbiGii toxin family protein [Candidatus Paceibacterota bacterium]
MTLNSAIHKNILVQILIDIYSDTTISPYLGFKGGTAAYLLYGLERFSVDLDFDLLDESQENHVFDKVEKIVKKYGTIKDARKKRFNLFFLLSYDNKEENAQNIKVEINLRSLGSKYEVKAFNGVSMLVMIQTDMFAHKLVAMHERLGQTNRDIFDVWFFSKSNWEINKEIVEKRTEMTYKAFLEKCISELEEMSNHNILDGIGELLTEKQKDWVRSNLKLETILQLKLRLESEK